MLRDYRRSVYRIQEAISLMLCAGQDTTEMESLMLALKKPHQVEDKSYCVTVMLCSHTCLSLARYYDGQRALRNKQRVLIDKFKTPEITLKIKDLEHSDLAVASNIENYSRLLSYRIGIIDAIVQNKQTNNRYYRQEP